MNWGEIITIVLSLTTIIGCFFAWAWSRLDKKFDKIDQRFDKLIGNVDQRFDKLIGSIKEDSKENKNELKHEFFYIKEELKEIRTGMNRLEGAIYSKDCCMLKDEKISKKAK